MVHFQDKEMPKYRGGQVVKELSHYKKIVYLAMTLILVLSVAFLGFSCKTTTTTTPATTTKPVATTTPAATTAPVTTKPATTTPAATTIAPKTGGTLKIYMANEPFSLFPPSMSGQTDGENANLCVETLFRLDEKGNVVPWLATDYIADPDSNTFTIHLRKGVKFTDGSDFNAAVVKWNMQQYKAGSKSELANVSTIDTPDDYTVLLHMKQFDNTLILSLTTSGDAGRIVSMQSFNANGGKTWAEKNPVGTGPFKFVSWTKDVSIIYSRNDNYWGGKVYLDQVKYLRYADQTTAQIAFANGDIDIFGPDPSVAKPLIDSGKYNWAVSPEGQMPAYCGYGLDPASPFSKLEVRQALTYAINPKALSDTFGLGYWQVTNQWSMPGTWGYNTNVVGYPFNTAKAKQLLASAGYTTPISCLLNFYNTSQTVLDENTAVQKMLNDAGFNITLNPLQRNPFVDMATNGKGWSGIVRMQGASSVDPIFKYYNATLGTEFHGMYMPQEFLDTFKQADQTADQATKQKLTQQLMSIAIDKYCMHTPIYIQGVATVKQKRVMDDGYAIQPYRWVSPFTWVTDGK
jgi:peptide/nickel transport system substrate-binding protein